LGIKKIVGSLIHTNLFLSLCVTSLVFETYLILYQKIPNLEYSFLLFCSTLLLYCFHRVFRFDFRAKEEQLAARHVWVKRNKFLFFMVMYLAASGVAVSLLFFVSWSVILPLLPIALISLAYTVPCIPTRKGLIRLRDVPGMKILLISFVLGLTTVLLPVLANSDIAAVTKPEFLFVFFRRVLFIFAITIPFDIRDMQYDREMGTRTLPVIFGVTTAKRIALTALAMFCGLALFQYIFMEGAGLVYFLALILSASVTAIIVIKSNEKREDVFYSVFVEGMMLLQCLLVIVASRF